MFIFYNSFFNRNEENDICEVYLILIEKIHNELSYDISSILNNNPNNPINKIAKFNENKYSHIYDLLQGIYIHSIKCLNCNYINNSYEPFIYINLNIYFYGNLLILYMSLYFINLDL